jgi:hypothetical protein
LQGVKISAFLVRATLFPTDKKDADPLKGQGSNSHVVSFTSSAMSLIKALSPRAIANRASSELMKRLTQELGASLPKVDGSFLFTLFATFFAAGSSYRSDAA